MGPEEGAVAEPAAAVGTGLGRCISGGRTIAAIVCCQMTRSVAAAWDRSRRVSMVDTLCDSVGVDIPYFARKR